MKFLIFLISIIFIIKVFTKIEKRNLKEFKEKKKKYIFEHYFLNKIKTKSNRNIENFFIKGDSDDLSYNFDFWERKQYKNLKSNNNEVNTEQSKKYDNNNINYITKELNVINEDYKTNDLLTKFNNRKFIEDEPIPDLNSDNFPNMNNNNNKYKEFLHKNEINQEYQQSNNIYDKDTIGNINLMNQMNDHHNPRGFPHHFNSDQMGKSTYFDSQSTYRSSQEQHSNYQQFSSNAHNSKFGEGVFGRFYQIIMAAGFFGLIYRLFFGNKQNDKYAMGWYDSNIDYFKERYELIGLIEDDLTGTYRKPEANLNTKSLMVKENINCYQFICGNYRYII